MASAHYGEINERRPVTGRPAGIRGVKRGPPRPARLMGGGRFSALRLCGGEENAGGGSFKALVILKPPRSRSPFFFFKTSVSFAGFNLSSGASDASL